MIPETIPSLLLIFESAITQFSSIIYVAAANQFLLPKCGVSSEPVFAASWCQQRTVFAATSWCQHGISFLCRIMVSAANQFPLSNCGVSNELVFADDSMFQRISSLTNMRH
jgi:hypothetical protein